MKIDYPLNYLVSHPCCSNSHPFTSLAIHPVVVSVTSFSLFLCSLSAATRCRAGERWRTPGWSARKTTSMSASCACVPSWTTRSENRPRPPQSNRAALSPGNCAHLSDWRQIQLAAARDVSFIMRREEFTSVYSLEMSSLFVFLSMCPCSTASTWSCHTRTLSTKLH